MADVRQEKLAAARKKLQKFQQKKTPSSAPASVKPGKNSKAKNPPLNGPVGDAAIENAKAIHDTPTGKSEESPSNRSSARPLSSTESLRQLSRQLNGLMNESPLVNGTNGVDHPDSGLKELEVRNQELAAEVDQQTQSNRKLLIQIGELKKQCKNLQNQLETERKEFDDRTFREQSALKEQLQVHIQTIGILVSEKTELQGLASQARSHLKQKTADAGNLSSRLQASRQRVAELERNLLTVNSSTNQLQKSREDIDKERESLRKEVYRLRTSSEELSQRNSEIMSKLSTKVSENKQLGNSIRELEQRLSMSDLRVQQLSAQSSNHDTEGALQRLQEEKMEVENKLAQYAQAVQQLTGEREYLSQQYRTNTSQLQEHCQQLAEQVQSLTRQNVEVISREEDLSAQIKALTNSKDTGPTIDPAQSEEIERLQERLRKAEQDTIELHKQCTQQVSDNNQLSRIFAEKEAKLEEMESILARFKEDAADRKALLESIQNDKATISRAVAQNKDLKTQLEELQDAFVKMSEDNMKLTTSLQSEQHQSDQLQQESDHRGEEVEEMQQQLATRQEEVAQVEEQLSSMKRELLQHAQMSDRAHHYAANQPLVDSLQRELGEAQENLRAVSEENHIVRAHLARLEEGPSLDQTGEERENSIVAELSAALRQLEAERDQLRSSFIEEEAQRRMLQDQLNHSGGSPVPEGASFHQKSVTQEAFETLQLAMDKLTERFTQVMRDKVDLIERCQELEHVNMQLTGETETIGEYITLYHNQRSVLKRRQQERERFVVTLAREKESMQDKLNQLQNLVMQLLQEKKELHPYQFAQGLLPLTPTRSPTNHPHAFKVQGESASRLEETNHEVGDDWPSSSESGESMEEGTIAEEDYETANASSVLQVPSEHIPVTEHTAHQIIRLLQQMGGSSSIDRGTILDRDFLPCKCCSGKMIDV